jgi:hypothetical protein
LSLWFAVVVVFRGQAAIHLGRRANLQNAAVAVAVPPFPFPAVKTFDNSRLVEYYLKNSAPYLVTEVP